MTTEMDTTVRCLTCGAEWNALTDKPPKCFTEGHVHHLNGIPVTYDPRLNP